MAELIPIGGTEKRQNRLIDVIFVHGFGGDPFKSWGIEKPGDRNSMLYWLIDEPEMGNVGVWTLRHESCHWFFQPGLTRKQLIPDLFDRFIGLGECNLGRRILFVGHSDGGNVIKELLLYCHSNKGENGRRGSTSSAVLRLTSNVFFIGTPHRGAIAASHGSRIPFADKERAQEISTYSKELNELYRWWICTSQEEYGIESFSFIEGKGMIGSSLKVVDDYSGWAGIGDKQSIPRNHNEIAKPKLPIDQPYYKICLKIKELLEELDKSPEMQLVTSKPLCVKNNQIDEVECEKQVWRLLVVARKHLDSDTPANSGGIKIDLAIMLKLPDGSEYYPGVSNHNKDGLEWIHENLTLNGLAEVIIKIYPDYERIVLTKAAEGGNPNPMLLPTLFLPFDLFGNQYIYLLLSKIRERLAEIQASRAGLPLILACSSRYRLNIYDNILPSLNYSRSDLENKSKEIVHILSAAETPLSRLNWNLIHDDLSRSDQIADVSRDSVFPLAISQKLCAAEFDEILNSLLQGKNLEIDPLQDSHSLFLCWNYNTSPESPGRYWVAIQRLLNIGIPLMWIQGAMPEPGQSSGPGTESTSLEEAAEHADTLLGWAHGEFHCRFYRYNCKRLAPGQQDEVGIRRYVRNGILFWEDHRFLPREMPEPPTKVPLL